MQQGDNQSLGYRVGQALNGQISKQPVTNAGKVDSKPENATAKKSSSNMAFTTMKQKGMPNRSYNVSAINKAQAKMGGH